MINWGIQHQIQDISLNGVDEQTSATLDSTGICWRSLISVPFISFPHTVMTNLN